MPVLALVGAGEDRLPDAGEPGLSAQELAGAGGGPTVTNPRNLKEDPALLPAQAWEPLPGSVWSVSSLSCCVDLRVGTAAAAATSKGRDSAQQRAPRGRAHLT